MLRRKLFIALGVFILVIVLGISAVFTLHRTVYIRLDGQVHPITTWVTTVGSALHDAGIPIAAADRLSPPLGAWITFHPEVTLQRAVPVRIAADGAVFDLLVVDGAPAQWLAQAGVNLDPGDAVLLNGLPVALEDSLPHAQSYTLQVRRRLAFTLNDNGRSQNLHTSAVNLGQALWDAGISVAADDALSLPLETPLTAGLALTIRRAIPLTITAGGRPVQARSSASTVGTALAQAGLPLQELDYSLPAEDQPLPADGLIRLVRVREEVLLTQQTQPFETRWSEDPNTELDQKSVVQPGLEGITVTRTRVRYEDGKEVSRQAEGTWQARQPQERILGYGTKVVVHTDVVEGVNIEYWRKVTMFATSYSPCQSDADHCYPHTATGQPVQKGVAGVKKAWFGYMNGQPIFVPGYGTAVISDFGAGYPDGRAHIDLGYSDSDYVPWSSWVTVYFLTPVPAAIQWILQ